MFTIGIFNGISIAAISPDDGLYVDCYTFRQNDKNNGSCSTQLSRSYASIVQESMIYIKSLLRSLSAAVWGIFAETPLLFKNETPYRLETSRVLPRLTF